MGEVGELLETGLILRCRDGDSAAFAQLVEATQARSYALAWRLAGNSHDAMDMVQEGYMAIWRALPGLRQPEAFTAWFLRVFANACRNWLRRARRAPMPVEDCSTPWTEETEATPEDAVVQQERQRAVQAMMRSLPPIYAVTVTLHYVEGLGYRELAEVLDLPVRTVETRLRRAREMMRRHLAKTSMDSGGDGHGRRRVQGDSPASGRLS